MVGVVAFIAGGFLSVLLGRFAIIVGTSLEGAAAVVLGISSLISRCTPAVCWSKLSSGGLFAAFGERKLWAIGVVAAFLVLFTTGVYYQLVHGSRDRVAS